MNTHRTDRLEQAAADYRSAIQAAARIYLEANEPYPVAAGAYKTTRDAVEAEYAYIQAARRANKIYISVLQDPTI